MKKLVAAALGVLVLTSVTPGLFAKGNTARITLTSADLQNPIEISDPDIVKNFNVWAGAGTFMGGIEANDGFIVDWSAGTVTDRPTGLREYEVSFYVRNVKQAPGEPADVLVYVVTYATDPGIAQGFVYLPGKADEHFRLNTRAISRRREGNWFRASAAWQNAVRQFIGQAAR
jgi:hypothetical protein